MQPLFIMFITPEYFVKFYGYGNWQYPTAATSKRLYRLVYKLLHLSRQRLKFSLLHKDSIKLSTKLGFLPPANEVWGKVIFSVACVKNSVHRGEYLGRYTPQSGTPMQVHPQQVHFLGRYTSPGAVHAGKYRQQAGGTHPTGMHSSFFFYKKMLSKHFVKTSISSYAVKIS